MDLQRLLPVLQFIDDMLDGLPAPSQIGATRVGDIDLNKPRIRAALDAVLALAVAPGGFTAAEFTAKASAHHDRADPYRLHHPPGRLRPAQIRGKATPRQPAHTRRYHVPPLAARTIAALITLRDHVIAPILAAWRSPRPGRKPKHWTRLDRDYETLRVHMQTLFNDLGMGAAA